MSEPMDDADRRELERWRARHRVHLRYLNRREALDLKYVGCALAFAAAVPAARVAAIFIPPWAEWLNAVGVVAWVAAIVVFAAGLRAGHLLAVAADREWEAL